MTAARISIPHDQIEAFCRKWRITELALFGSVLRGDFRPDSDVDVLFTLEPGVHWPRGGYADMTEGLEAIFGRKVDLVSRKGVEQSPNYITRKLILGSAEVSYPR
jgi:predicted nucleotidyltransferase